MAGAQGLERKDEAALKELIEKAKDSHSQDEMIFGGWLYNKRQDNSDRTLSLHDDHVWSGNFYAKYPKELKESASFVQTEKYKNGIKTAVVYSIKTGETPMNGYGYLLAWSDTVVSGGQHERKVYGYCGLLEKFDHLDWEKVAEGLEKGSSSFSYIDAYTRTSVKAEIHANVVYAEFI